MGKYFEKTAKPLTDKIKVVGKFTAKKEEELTGLARRSPVHMPGAREYFRGH